MQNRIMLCLLCGLFFIGTSEQVRAQRQATAVSQWYDLKKYRRPLLLATTADKLSIINRLKQADATRAIYTDNAQAMALLCLEESKDAGFVYGVFYAMNSFALTLIEQGQYDSAISVLSDAIVFMESENYKDQIFKYYLNIGISYFYAGKYEQALENYYRSLELIGKNNKKVSANDSVIIYSNIGLIWSRFGEEQEAFSNLHLGENIAVHSRDSAMLANIYLLLGGVFADRTPSKAVSYYHKALEIGERLDKPLMRLSALNELAHLYTAKGHLDNEWMYARAAADLLVANPGITSYDRFHTEHNLGRAYMDRGEYQKAKVLLLSAFSQVKAIQLKDIIPHMEPDVANIYAFTGAYKEAYEHMRHYALSNDTLLEQGKMRTFRVWMQARMKEKNKAMMAQNLYIVQQQKQLQSKNFFIGAAIAGAMLLLTFLLIALRSYRNKQNLQQASIQQLQQEQQISQLKAQVRGEEQERNRIARELHDSIASQLWAIKLNVDSLQFQDTWDKPQRHRLGSIYRQLDDTTQDVRKTAHNLMPDLLLQEGLSTAVASVCEKIKSNTGLEVDFLEYGDIPRLDEDIELTLYRMIQELIQNVMKHARGATQLLVQISCRDVLLNITVEDNGSGFIGKEEEREEGTGLEHIRKKVNDLQGQMDLQSIPGKGTTVYLEFDIQHLL